jgi:hypothetical protein
VVVGAFFFIRYVRGLQSGADGVAVAGPDGEAAGAPLAQEPPEKDDYRARIESELREM